MEEKTRDLRAVVEMQTFLVWVVLGIVQVQLGDHPLPPVRPLSPHSSDAGQSKEPHRHFVQIESLREVREVSADFRPELERHILRPWMGQCGKIFPCMGH